MYILSSFKDGGNYCLEIKTPFENRFHVFPTHGGYREYLENYIWHLNMSKKQYKWGELIG